MDPCAEGALHCLFAEAFDTPMLTGARTNLRVVGKDDFDWLLVELNKPQSRGQWSAFNLRTPADLDREMFETPPLGGGDLVIEDKKGKRLGLATWLVLDPVARSAAIEVALFDPADRGKGMGLEAHRLLVDHLFKHRGLHRVEVLTAAENVPEHKLLEKLRFLHEGILRKARFAGGAWHDLHLYAILEDEWQALHWDQLSF